MRRVREYVGTILRFLAFQKNAFFTFLSTNASKSRYKSSVLCPQTLENSSQLRFDFTLNFLILRAILAPVKQLFMALNSL